MPARTAPAGHARTIAALVESHDFRAAPERAIQDALESILAGAALSYRRECRLGPGDVVDFLVGGVAVEVKVGGTATALVRQLHRYAASAEVAAFLVVTTREALARRVQGLALRGKPVSTAVIAGAFL